MTWRPSLSAVVVSRNEGDWLRETIGNLQDTLPNGAEIVVVDDGSDDGSAAFLNDVTAVRLVRCAGLGAAAARNHGARSSGGDVVIFIDAHMRFAPCWWRPLLEVLEQPGIAATAPAVAPTNNLDAYGYGFSLPDSRLQPAWIETPHLEPRAVPILPGCCMAVKREAFHAAGGFDEGLYARGGIDAETSLRFWLHGLESWVVPEAKVWHYFRTSPPFPVSLIEVLHNRLRLAMVHLSPRRIGCVIQTYGGHPLIGHALLLLSHSNCAQQRQELRSRRIYDDSWFFDRFDILWKDL